VGLEGPNLATAREELSWSLMLSNGKQGQNVMVVCVASVMAQRV
jgi:hypothetical protein